MRHTAALSILILAFAAVIAGCGGDPGPSTIVLTAPPSLIPPLGSSPAPSTGASGSTVDPSAPASQGPAGSPIPSGTVLTIELPGKLYEAIDQPPTSSATADGDALLVKSTRDNFISSRVTYDLPPGTVPEGTEFSRIDMKLCGEAGGDFWEIYAPYGGEPLEQEVTQPQGDGCWHFDGADEGNTEFELFVSGEAFMRIAKVVYTLTVGTPTG